jgi:predicted glutamine amidotransferase
MPVRVGGQASRLHPQPGIDSTTVTTIAGIRPGGAAPRHRPWRARTVSSMCRLFGLHGRELVTATFWLLDAPDDLIVQSKTNPDGTGLGVFDGGGKPVVDKQPIAAWEDTEFAREAREMTGTTFIAHVRHASTGDLDVHNTHPFVQDERIFAHNGVVRGLDVLDAQLAQLGVADLVLGETDSERVFAMITASIRAEGGDVEAGLLDAMNWLAVKVPIYAVNLLLSTATDVWALRYPETHGLYLLDRRKPETSPDFDLQTSRIHARSKHLDDKPSVVFASEPMDDDPGWRLLGPGTLVHVDSDLAVTERIVLPAPPKHQLGRADLSAKEALSQHPLVGRWGVMVKRRSVCRARRRRHPVGRPISSRCSGRWAWARRASVE